MDRKLLVKHLIRVKKIFSRILDFVEVDVCKCGARYGLVSGITSYSSDETVSGTDQPHAEEIQIW